MEATYSGHKGIKMDSSNDILCIKGVGEKSAQLFHKLGIYTTEDLIQNYPRDYISYPEPKKLSAAKPMEMIAVYLRICGSFSFKKVRNLVIGSGTATDGEQTVRLTFFNTPYLKQILTEGSSHLFYGKLQLEKNHLVLEQPVIYDREAYEQMRAQLQPVYGLTKGLTNTLFRKSIRQVLAAYSCEEYIPRELLDEYRLVSHEKALRYIHFPQNTDELQEGRRRLVFEELFLFLLMLRRMKDVKEEDSTYPMLETAVTHRFMEMLPFPLTNAQKRVYQEVIQDLTGGKCMNRLIQGDVGSGKTILAFLALLTCVDNGYQGALMAPTELLATQHFEQLCEWTKVYGLPFKPLLLTGSVGAAAKKEAYRRIEDGEVNVIIGTHALIQDKVRFNRLALVITDEQHRFGVRQRETFSLKGGKPHVLVMSATPIPRTLAIILYGDLHVSLVDELPAQRLPIKNCVVGTSYRPKAYEFMQKEISKGRQVYVICPMVEDNEAVGSVENVTDYTAKLRSTFPKKLRIEMLHGKMKPQQKQTIMEQFAAGNIDILVSTTVIEVGINVPNATVMMIENAERFGLAQLHQLRGRIGRGSEQSYCIFMDHSEEAKKSGRLKIINESNDGFYIAEQDLKLRGPGDLFGIRQSGLMEFKLADIYQDAKLLTQIAHSVDELLARDESLTQPQHRLLKQFLEQNTLKFVDFRSI